MVLDDGRSADFSSGHGSFARCRSSSRARRTSPGSQATRHRSASITAGTASRSASTTGWWSAARAGPTGWSDARSVSATLYACPAQGPLRPAQGRRPDDTTVVMRFDDSFASVHGIVGPKFDALRLVGTLDVVTDAVAARLPDGVAHQRPRRSRVGTHHLLQEPSRDAERERRGHACRHRGVDGVASATATAGHHITPPRAARWTTVCCRCCATSDSSVGICPAESLPTLSSRAGRSLRPLEAEGAMVDATVSLAAVKGWIDRIVENGASLCLYFDDIGGDNDLSQADFSSLCDYIAGKGLQPDGQPLVRVRRRSRRRSRHRRAPAA